MAEYGVDRPTMGDVLWNLEYALQLQETGSQREPLDYSCISAPELPTLRAVPRVPSINVGTGGDSRGDDGTSDISTSQVFSQLMTNDGR